MPSSRERISSLRRYGSPAMICCSCNTRAGRPAFPRARRSRTATLSPIPSSSRHSCSRTCGVPGEEVVVTALPLYHVFALMVNFISYYSLGAENWLVPNPRDMDGFVGILREARCTVFTGVNTLFGGLVMHPKIGEVDFTTLRVAIGGGASVHPATSAKWKALTGADILEGYGLSETSPILTLNPM